MKKLDQFLDFVLDFPTMILAVEIACLASLGLALSGDYGGAYVLLALPTYGLLLRLTGMTLGVKRSGDD